MENLNLTVLETEFLTALIQNLYAERYFSDVTVSDMKEYTGHSTKVLRGVASSLIQKGIISIQDNGEGFDIIYLEEEYHYLHPEWSKQIAV